MQHMNRTSKRILFLVCRCILGSESQQIYETNWEEAALLQAGFIDEGSL